MNQKLVEAVGMFGMVMALVMFIAMFDQIILNWNGKPGSVWMPLALTINCIAWTVYGFFKSERDLKIVIPNAVGIIMGAVTTLTAVCCFHSCSF